MGGELQFIAEIKDTNDLNNVITLNDTKSINSQLSNGRYGDNVYDVEVNDGTTNNYLKFKVKLKDYYNSNDSKKANGYWLKADITDIKLKLSSITKGEIKIQANVPGITSSSNQSKIIKFATDSLDTIPSFVNYNGNSIWIGVDKSYVDSNGVDWNCGIAN